MKKTKTKNRKRKMYENKLKNKKNVKIYETKIQTKINRKNGKIYENKIQKNMEKVNKIAK